MAPKCTVCGADDATSHVCAGDLEETYQRDLRDLAARSRETLAPPPMPEDAVGLEAPASVREAIRLADTLIPVAQPEPLLLAALAIGDPPPHWGRRVAVAAVLTAGALAGVLVWHAEGRAPMPAQQAAAAAVAAVTVATPVEVPAPVVATPAPVRIEAPRVVASARPVTAIVARPRAVKPAAVASAAPPPAPTAQPTLMEAIVDSVVSRRGAASGTPTR
jgi:hypothetical protein